MPTPTQVLQEKVNNLEGLVTGLVEKLDKLIPVGPDKNLTVAAPSAILPNEILKEFGESDPIPQLYRQAIDEILNKNFGIHLKGHTDAAQFSFTIIVPEKYSTLTPEQKAINKADLRLKVITYAEGINGVREYAELVFKNFDSTRQSLIVADRLNAN